MHKINFIICFSSHFSFFYHLLDISIIDLHACAWNQKGTDNNRMRKRRKFYRGATNHVYQRTVDGVQLFYTIEDCLVFYTIFATCAKSAEIKISTLCLMHNHLHFLAKTYTVQELSAFVDHYTAWFVHEYNTFVGRKGKLFKKNFGSAPKWDEKKLRSAIIYIGNNPVEKHFCKKAIQHRWNFLAYWNNDHPFSEKIIKSKASRELNKALKEVDLMVMLNRPLKYAQLIRLTRELSEKEMEQFVDYVIFSYSPFDYDELASHFKSFDLMLEAMDSTTGDDYDINEPRDSFSLDSFNDMMRHMQKSMKRYEIRKVTALPLDKKMEILNELRLHSRASEHQICNFLHISTKRK